MEIQYEVRDDHVDGVGTSVGTPLTIPVSYQNGYNIEEDEIYEIMNEHNNGLGEIEELNSEASSGPIANSYRKPREESKDEDDVYVAVGKSNSSMDALSWALKNETKPGSFVYLIHVSPPVKFIPAPFGYLAIKDATEQQVDAYMNQEMQKRREMLRKYENLCRLFNVNCDVFPVENDQIADGIGKLIPVLNIKKLVVGTSKSNLRKMKRGATKAAQIQKKAPLYCDIKLICEGEEVKMTGDETPPASPLAPVRVTRSAGNTPESSPLSHEVETSNDKKKKNKVPKIFRWFSSKKL